MVVRRRYRSNKIIICHLLAQSNATNISEYGNQLNWMRDWGLRVFLHCIVSHWIDERTIHKWFSVLFPRTSIISMINDDRWYHNRAHRQACSEWNEREKKTLHRIEKKINVSSISRNVNIFRFTVLFRANDAALAQFIRIHSRRSLKVTQLHV